MPLPHRPTIMLNNGFSHPSSPVRKLSDNDKKRTLTSNEKIDKANRSRDYYKKLYVDTKSALDKSNRYNDELVEKEHRRIDTIKHLYRQIDNEKKSNAELIERDRKGTEAINHLNNLLDATKDIHSKSNDGKVDNGPIQQIEHLKSVLMGGINSHTKTKDQYDNALVQIRVLEEEIANYKKPIELLNAILTLIKSEGSMRMLA